VFVLVLCQIVASDVVAPTEEALAENAKNRDLRFAGF
jgi:hypothetical protein